MKVSYLALFLFLIAHKVIGQTKVDSIPFVAYWQNGDCYNFKVTKLKQQWQGDKLIKNDSATFQANFTVLDSSETGYRIKWAYDIDWSKFSFADSSTSELIKNIAKDMIMEATYKTDEVGQYMGLENFEEIKNKMLNIFDKISEHFEKSGKMPPEQSKKMNQALLKLFSSQELVEQMVAEDILLFHSPFGIIYPVRDTLLYTGEMQNPFGNTPIPARTSIFTNDLDLDNSFCVISQITTINPTDAKKYLLALLPQLGIPANEIKKMAQTSTLDISDKKHFEYWYNPGVPYFIEASKQAILHLGEEKLKRIDITRIQYND